MRQTGFRKRTRIKLSDASEVRLAIAGLRIMEPDDSWRLQDHFMNADYEAAIELLRRGADVNRTGGDGDSALHRVSYFPDPLRAAVVLLDHGAQMNARNAYGQTPLHRLLEDANYRRVTPELVSLFLRAGAAVTACDKHGRTALDYVISRKGADSRDLVKLLETYRAPD